MKPWYRTTAVIAGMVLTAGLAFAASHAWETGKVVDTERQTFKNGSMTTFQSDGKGSSRTTTAQTMDDNDTYEVYTIRGPEKTYVAREKLNFPWSKPAKVTVGAELKYAIDGRKLVILDEDHKEHKASIIKTSLNDK